MGLKKQVEKLEARMIKEDYDLTALTDAELLALNDCYTGAGDYLPERMTPDLSAALERVRLSVRFSWCGISAPSSNFARTPCKRFEGIRVAIADERQPHAVYQAAFMVLHARGRDFSRVARAIGTRVPKEKRQG
jgi:hypothetical protein